MRFIRPRILGLLAVGLIAGCAPGGSPSAAASASPNSQTSSQASAGASASAAASSSPAASQSPIPAGTSEYASAGEAGIGGVEAKTGITFTGGNCGTAQSCLSAPQIFGNLGAGGNDAALVTITEGSTTCYAYVYFAGGFWHYTNPVVCPQQAGYNPVPGGQTHIVAPASCANVRKAPGLGGNVVTCLKDGTVVSIDSDNPFYVDRYIWWSVNGHQGWVAQDFLITSGA